MKQHLTYKDDKSYKFWQIEVAGKSFTVTYGKTGTTGTSQTKTFESEDKCAEEAQRLLNEKLNKGYTVQQQEESQVKWQQLLREPDLTKALGDHITVLEKSMTKQIAHYFKSLAEGSEEIGGILFFWDDAGSNSAFLACYVEGINDKNKILEEFDAGDEAVGFEDFLSKIIPAVERQNNAEGWDFLMRLKTEIICPLLKDVLKKSIDSAAFKKLPKLKPFYIFFSSYHDNVGEEELIVEYGTRSVENNKSFEGFSIGWQKYLSNLKEIKQPKDLKKITRITLSASDGITALYDAAKLTELHTIEITGNFIEDLSSLNRIAGLKNLVLHNFNEDLSFLTTCHSLKSLWLRTTNANQLAENKFEEVLSNLEELGITGGDLTEIPNWILRLDQLKYLNLSYNKISSVPDELQQLKSLKTIWIGRNKIPFAEGGIKIKTLLSSVKVFEVKDYSA